MKEDQEAQQQEQAFTKGSTAGGFLQGLSFNSIVVFIVFVVGLTVGIVLTVRDARSPSRTIGINSGGATPVPQTPPTSPLEPTPTPPDDGGSSSSSWGYQETEYYMDALGSLSVKMPFLNPSSIRGYSSCEELREDLTQAGRLQALHSILARSYNKFFPEMMEDNMVMTSNLGGTASETTTTSSSGETDYSTNNQEEDVEEADGLKSDGTFVYGAYGDLLIVFDPISGEEVYRLQMPSIDSKTGTFDPLAEEVIHQATTITIGTKRSALFSPMPNRPLIQKMLLDEENKRLLLIVSGYGNTFRTMMGEPYIFQTYGNTHLRLYDLSNFASGGGLTLLAYQDLSGSFQAARAIDSTAHIVTMATMQSRAFIDTPLAKWQTQFQEMTDEQYHIAAADLAEETVVPEYVDRIMSETIPQDQDCSNMLRLGLLQSSDYIEFENRTTMMDLYPSGVLNGYAEVTTFDMATNVFNGTKLLTTAAGAFLPTTSSQVYASDTMMILASVSYDLVPGTNQHSPYTYLFGFSLTPDRSVPAAMATVPGYILNTFSLDHHDGHIRVATTIPELFSNPTPISIGVSNPFMQRTQVQNISNQLYILEIPDDIDPTSNETAQMTQVGVLEGLGHEGESIFAVRFLDALAFVVTFRQTDPFYTIDLSDPTNPTIMGELQIPGFSNYLHPINDEQTLVLGVGQDVNPETGRNLGLQISLFDVSDLTAPKQVTKYVVNEGGSSYSSAQNNHLAFRYLKESRVLILPVSLYDRSRGEVGNFDGFFTFDITDTTVTPRFNISHVQSSDMWSYCWYPATLPQRSMVFSGNLVTTKGHSILSHSLAEGTKNWELDLDTNNTKGCSLYFPFMIR